MRTALVSLVLLGLAAPLQAHAQASEDFEPMARACETFLATGRFPSATEEAAFFERAGYKGAASTVRDGEVSRTYTRSGTPVDAVMIMVARPAEAGGETCSVLALTGAGSGDSFLARTRADTAWSFEGESNDDNGKGYMFEKALADAVVDLAIWGTGAAYPISVASYQIGTSD